MSRNVQLVLVVAAGLCIGLWIKRTWVREGELREKIHAREVTIAALARQAHTADTAYVRDTVTLTRWRTTYRVAHDSLRVTDTVAVKQFVLIADSTIKACSVALETCEHRVAIRDSIIGAKDDLLALERKRRPSFLGMLLTKATWAAIGYGAGRLTR